MMCPFCFKQVNRVHFRCISLVPGACPPEEDKLLAMYQRLSTPPLMKKVFDGPPPQPACPQCGTLSAHGVCPYCHNQLPMNDVSAKSLLFALVGAKNVGKSHYIAVLIHELQNLAAAHGAGVMPLGQQTIKRYNSDFRSHLYSAHRTIPVTQPAMVNQAVRAPLIYRWSRATETAWSRASQKVLGNKVFKTSMLTFFDTAGEDLREEDVMAVENRYVALSDGLIFLLDPLQIPAVREMLQGTTELPEEDVDPLDIIVRVTQMIRNMLGIKQGDLIKIPLAVTFSKIDAVRSILDPASPLLRASPSRSEFDEGDSLRVHESVRAHLQEWMGSALDGIVSVNYSHYRYFGVSALGGPPSSDGLLYNGTSPAPLRVEDPVLWLLSRHGLVRVKGKG